MYKVVFMGTPSIADTVLNHLLTIDNISVEAIVAQPDKPKGRKKKLTPPPTKITGEKMGIKVYQPEKVRKNKEFREIIKNIEPDFFIVIAYGKILPTSILNIPKYLPINIHTSLLPKYRGSSPIHYSLLNGDDETGVTFMKMERSMDTGSIYMQKSLKIDGDDNYTNLENKLSKLSCDMLSTFFKEYPNIDFVEQDHQKATYTKLIEKKDGLIDFNRSLETIIGKIRAFNEWPKPYFFINKVRYNIIKAKAVYCSHGAPIGGVEITKEFMKIYTKEGYLSILLIQPQAKKAIDIKSFYNGKGRTLSQTVVDNI